MIVKKWNQVKTNVMLNEMSFIIWRFEWGFSREDLNVCHHIFDVISLKKTLKQHPQFE